PGSSTYRFDGRATAVCANYAEVREQAHTTQDASHNDHHHQSNQQCCTDSRKTPSLLLDWHRWLQGRMHNSSRRCNQLTRLRRLGRSSALWCRGVWVEGWLEIFRWQIGRGGRLRWKHWLTRRHRHCVI